MTGRRPLLAAVLITCTVAVGACASSDDTARKQSLEAIAQVDAPVQPTEPAEPVECTDALQSYRPAPSAGGAFDDARRKGTLVVGVDENTLQLSARDTESHEFEGFEVALAHAIGDAVFGGASGSVEFRPVVTEEKVPFVEQRTVDMTISAVSMNCERWERVDFSQPYLLTDQRVLVRSESPVQSLADLADRKVCVTAGGTTFDKLKDKVPTAVKVEKPARTDCLLALQDGDVEAIASHATILYGLQAQDRDNTRIVAEPFSQQSYGVAVAKSKDHSRARFVNRVLEAMRADGSMGRLYDSWIGEPAMPAGTATLPESIEYRSDPT
jgi:polar amino acid transport system substrate-binding protein